MKLTTFVVMFVAVSGFAQMSERVEVNLVNVDATVLDRHGAPVPKLTESDFEILEDGVRQKITHFSVVTTNEPSRSRVVVALIDERTMSDKFARNQAIAKIEDMLGGTDDGSVWSVVRLRSSLETVVPFTSDRRAIKAGFDAVLKGLPSPEAAKEFTTPFDPNDDFE